MTNNIERITNREAANLTGWSKHTPVETSRLHGGIQYLFRFENGYGASLVNHSGSYGNEIAVIRWDENGEFDIVYDTPVTSDVLGWLFPDEIESTLDAIKALPIKAIES